MSKALSVYQELTNEALVSEHTANVSDERASKFRDGTGSYISALAMSELFNEDARLWRRLADGWDVETALALSAESWRQLCRKPKHRGRGFETEEWRRRLGSYTLWRMETILSTGADNGSGGRRTDESVYIALVDENEKPVRYGLLLGPVENVNTAILDLVKSLRRRYLIDNPEMAPGKGIELVEVVSTSEGRLNSHPIWGEMFEDALEG